MSGTRSQSRKRGADAGGEEAAAAVASTGHTVAKADEGAGAAVITPETASDAEGGVAKEVDAGVVGFAQLGLDDRLLKAVADLGWKSPTLIQGHVVREALSGKDVLARARTGSGKTAAYALPMLHLLLGDKRRSVESKGTAGLVLVPTKELSRQAGRNIREIARFCSRDIEVVDVSGGKLLKAQKAALRSHPDIVVGTPSQVRAHIDAGAIDLSKSLKMLVIDEADLVFSYGYEEDVVALLAKLPPIRQNLLMSATLGSEVEALKKLVLRRPVVLKLKEADLPGVDQLSQFSASCTPDDKFLIAYALLKLRLLRGKTLFFVNNIDRCYKLKLFFDEFGIKSCVLNSELPIQSRQHIVSQFNKGIYDYLLASDEAIQAEKKAADAARGGRKRQPKDNEYGVARGVDFREVKNVVNFDFPLSAKSYVHRVGRTARGHNAGVALSLVGTAAERSVLAEAQDLLRADVTAEDVIKPYAFKVEAIDGLRYRVRGVIKSVTKLAIRNARRQEIRQEILNSEVLKAHFEENPRDAEVLRHDTGLTSGRQPQAHLKHLPGYLVPKGTEAARGRKRKDVSKFVQSKSSKAKRKKQSDPLKSFGGK